MAHKLPYRPESDITQQYNDGIVTIYQKQDTAKPGYQPKPGYTPKYTVRFEQRALGLKRIYLARQDQAEIKHVIRIPKVGVSVQDVAQLSGDEHMYRIDTVQQPPNVFPPSLDLGLVEIDQKLEVAGNDLV